MNATTSPTRNGRFSYRLAVTELVLASLLLTAVLAVAAVVIVMRAQEDPAAVLGWRGTAAIAVAVGLIWCGLHPFVRHLRATRRARAHGAAPDAA